jgi:hypothetical protein
MSQESIGSVRGTSRTHDQAITRWKDTALYAHLLFWFRLIGSSLHKCLDNASKEQHGYFDWLSEFWLIEWVSECVKRDYAAYTGTGRGMYFLLLLAFCGGFLFCVALCLCPLWIHFLWSGRKLACTALHWLHCTLSTPTTRNMASGTRTQAKHMDGMHGWNGRAKQVLYSKSSSEFVSFQGTDLIMRLLLKCFTAKVWRCAQKHTSSCERSQPAYTQMESQ